MKFDKTLATTGLELASGSGVSGAPSGLGSDAMRCLAAESDVDERDKLIKLLKGL